MSDSPAPRDRIAATLSESLRDMAYVCGRVWEAWQYGTMSQDDFSPAWENDELLNSMADELVKAFPVLAAEPTTARVRRDDHVPSTAEVQVGYSCGIYDGENRREGQLEFRRWLEAHDKSVLAALAPEPAEENETLERAAEDYRDATGWNLSEGRAVQDAFIAGAQWAAVSPDEPKPAGAVPTSKENNLAESITQILNRYAQTEDEDENIEPEDGWRLLRDLRAAISTSTESETS